MGSAQKFVKIGSNDMIADRQRDTHTDRQTDRNTPPPTGTE